LSNPGDRLDVSSTNGQRRSPEAEQTREDSGADPFVDTPAHDGGAPAGQRAAIRLRRRRRVSGPFTALPTLRRDRNR